MPSENIIRTFIAAPLATDVHDFLLHHQSTIARHDWARGIRWIAQENVHLTLRFLGPTNQRQVDSLHQALQHYIPQLPAFEITLMQPGPFPTVKRPRVVAASVKRNEALEQLVQTIEAQVVKAGFAPEDRAYRGHITIGRVKRHIPGKELLSQTPQSIQTIIHSVVFFQSELTPEGAVYLKLHEYTLQG
jgi:2'-5' RNA ligase